MEFFFVSNKRLKGLNRSGNSYPREDLYLDNNYLENVQFKQKI